MTYELHKKKNHMKKNNTLEVTTKASDENAINNNKNIDEFSEKISDVMLKYERAREIKIRTRRVAKYEPTKMIWSGCILYYRRSTDWQDTTIESQRVDCTRKANELNLPIVKEYIDEISGKTEIHEREGLSDLMENIIPGQILIVYSVSRIARQIDVFYGIMKMLKERGCRVICCHEKLDSLDPHMEIIWAIHASFAQMEREAISSRTKRALDTLKKRGVNIGRPRWGYIIDKESKKLIPDPSTQNIIKWMIEARTEKQYGLEEIAKILNELNIPSLSGKCKWDRRMVSVVLQRELGEEEAGKYKLSRFINNRKKEKERIAEDIEFIQSLQNPLEDQHTEEHITEGNPEEKHNTDFQYITTELNPKSPNTTITETNSSFPLSKREQLMKKQIPYLKIMVQRKYKDMFTEEQLRDITLEELVDLLDE